LLALFVGTIVAVQAADWPYYQHDPEHTGRSTALVDAAQLMLSWTAPDGYATPQIVGDTIYSTKSQGGYSGTRDDGTQWATYISAFDLRTGAIKWTHSGNNVFSSQAAVGGGLVVFYGGMPCSGCSTPTPDAQQLVVLDANTGALRYKVAIPGEPGEPGGELQTMPLLIPNPSDGTVIAYCAGYRTLWSVRLGPTSGSIVWKWRSNGTDFGGFSMATLVGDAVAVGGTYELFAFDRISGTPIVVNESRSGGGGQTAAYDAARRNIYVSGYGKLSAYRYVSNAKIEFLWHRDGVNGDGIGSGSIAIGPNGNVYVAGGSHFFELDPETGATLRSVADKFFTAVAPSITAGLLWIPNSDGKTLAYDLDTLQLKRTLPGYNYGNRYPGAGAFADGYFVMPHGDFVFGKGFDVYREPAAQAVNMSTRLLVQAGEGAGIGGFIITGSAPKRVLLRGIGPSLTNFGIADALPDPAIDLHGPAGFTTIDNDNWKDTQEAEIRATGIPPIDKSESAILATLNPGAYTAIVSGKNNTSGVALVEVYDLDQPVTSKLANMSTRAFVGTGANVVIAGFILRGNGGATNVILRGIGPSLKASGVSNALTNPTLELHNSDGALVIANDNWQDDLSQAAIISAARLAPTDPLESAIAATLPAGAYTVLLMGYNVTGVGLVEVYDRGAP
jgi:hypothetical protein